jgi:peroxiredoxin
MTGAGRLICGVGWLCIVSFAAPAYAGKPTREYLELQHAAAFEAAHGSMERAYTLALKLYALAPDIEYASYATACYAARLGKTDEAFAWLKKAADLGFAWPDAVQANRDLESLHDDPRWQPFVDRIQANSDLEIREMESRRPNPDPAAAPAFKSYRKLAAAFDQRRDALANDRWRMSRKAAGKAALALQDEREAALHKYIDEHPDAKDREDAAWDAASRRSIFQFPFALKTNWGDAGTQGVEQLDAFLAGYPSTRHRAEALTLRAFAVFHIREKSAPNDRPYRTEDLKTLSASLGEVARQFYGSTAGGTALAWRLIVADVAATGGVTPEMREMRGQLETVYARDRDVQRLLDTAGRGVISRMDGFDGFDGTDLSGQRWNAARFAGKVTLVDYWATWCGPCVGELPTLRKIWGLFQPQGVQMLGVSLDTDSLTGFVAWLRENEVAWPQISDGKGFGSPLARKFKVRSIPFTVLIGPDGRVAATNLRGDDLIARIRELVEAQRVAVAPREEIPLSGP